MANADERADAGPGSDEPSDTSPASSPHMAKGILWMLLTMFCFVTMDTCAKLLVKDLPVIQATWGRYFFQVAILAVILFPRLTTILITGNLKLQLVRSFLLLSTTLIYFTGLRFVPLAEASAIMLVAPLVITMLSVPVLKEKVGPFRWAGVLIGFGGAMVIIRPGTDAMQLASLIPLAAAVLYAVYQISTRFLSHSESVLTTLCYSALLGAVVLSMAVPFYWEPLTLEHWLLMIAAGTFGTIGHFALINAYTAAPAAAVAPFTYTNLIWATAFGFFIFGDFPDSWTITGALIIAGSGLFIFYREQIAQRRKD